MNSGLNPQSAAAQGNIPEDRWMRVIAVAFVMYTIAFIDRTNISLALPSISRDLGLDPRQAGSAAGVFFWGYLVLQIPGGYLARRWSAKGFVAILLVVWGICSAGAGFVHTGREFWLMRLFLGVAEGGVWPAVLVLLANWFPRNERARANAFWMLCLPLAVVVSSPLSGWILGRWNWRVLLIAEGALPFVWLLVWLVRVYDHPREAPWISSAERAYLEATLASEAVESQPLNGEALEAGVAETCTSNSGMGESRQAAASNKTVDPAWRTLVSAPVLVMCLVYFMLDAGNYGYLFWLPTALGAAKELSHLLVGILFAVPYLITGAGMVLISQHSDSRRERRYHVAVPLAAGGLALGAGVLLSPYSPIASFALVALVGAGSYGALGAFWAIPTETLPPAVAGSAMGLVNALGNLGGYFGPWAVGAMNKRSGNLYYAFGLLSLALLAGGGLALLLPASIKSRLDREAGHEGPPLHRP